MTAQTKTTIKSYFETGDRPTQAQFSDLADSYIDTLSAFGNISAIASAGGKGIPLVTSTVSGALVSAGTVGLSILAAVTTAQAQAPLGLGSLATANSVSLVTQVSGNLPVANLNGGINASAGTFFRGDGTFSVVISAATQADQEAATSTTVYTSPGTQKFHPGAAKAWVNFNGTGTVAIRSSYNVSSITDNGTGNYTVNLTNAMSDANYCPIANYSQAATGTGVPGWQAKVTDLATSSFRISTGGDGTTVSTLADAAIVTAIVFGDM